MVDLIKAILISVGIIVFIGGIILLPYFLSPLYLKIYILTFTSLMGICGFSMMVWGFYNHIQIGKTLNKMK